MANAPDCNPLHHEISCFWCCHDDACVHNLTLGIVPVVPPEYLNHVAPVGGGDNQDGGHTDHPHYHTAAPTTQNVVTQAVTEPSTTLSPLATLAPAPNCTDLVRQL
jgi:hypothetical protein